MKKLMLVMLTLVLSGLAAMAKDPMVLESGSIAELNNPENMVFFKIDYKKATVHNDDKNYTLDAYLEHRGPDFVADWNGSADKAYSYLPVRFNQKNKKGAHAMEMEGKYDILGTVYLTDIDFGNGAGQFTPFHSAKTGGCIISGKLVFTDKDNKELAVLPFTEVKGMGHVSETIRLGLSYYELMNKLGDVIKKENKKKK